MKGKKLLASLLVGIVIIFTIITASFADVWVKGYYRKNGTYVQGYWRSDPDSNPYNNWSFPGNVNPHTGKVASGNPETYLKNYYDSKPQYNYININKSVEIKQWMPWEKALYMDVYLLEAKVEYMMKNLTDYLYVDFYYDPVGSFGIVAKPKLPVSVDTKDKIYVEVLDTRGVFSYKSGIALLEQFKKKLEVIYSYIDDIVADMNTDIVVIFYSKEGIPLGYFYQGKYHLWNE